MRSFVRPFSALLLAGAIVTCVDTPAAPTGSHGRATLAFVPQFSTSASQATPLYNANGLVYDSVRIIVTVPPTDAVTLKDTTVAFSTSDTSLSVDLSLDADPGQQLDLELRYIAGTQLLYDGKASVSAVPVGASGGTTPTTITINPVGPGAKTASLTIAPSAGSYPAIPLDTVKFSAVAVDSSTAVIANPVLVWSTSDTTLATIGVTSGAMVPTGKRGTVNVTVATLDKVFSSVAISLLPPATQIVVTSGGGQTGAAGQALAQPVVVEVEASDNGPVANQPVTFSSTTATVNPASGVTNASGQAQTTVTLGTTAGSYTIKAVSGTFTTTTAETATAGAAASIALNAGNNQSATVATGVAIPPSVIAKDVNGNPVSGTSVTFVVATGGGSVVGGTATTNANGVAAVTSWTLGTTPGANTLTVTNATLSGSPVTFTATGTVGAAATIAPNAGAGQTGTVGNPVAIPPSVIVKDAVGNPVGGVSVTFAVASGGGSVVGAAATTNASGIAAVTSWTLGTVSGSNTLTATSAGLAGSPVTFTATGGSGTAAKLSFAVNPPGNFAPNTIITPAVQVAVLDAQNNVVTSSSAAVTVALIGGTIPTLGGTLTRNAVNGVATFNDLTVNSVVPPGYALSAAATGLTGATSTTFSVSNAVASTIAPNSVTSQSAPAGSAVGSPPSVIVRDANNNPVGGVTVTFAVATGGGSVVGGVAPTNAGGIATVTSWTLGPVASTNTVTATVTGLAGSPVTFTATSVAGTAVKLALTVGVPATATAGAALSPAPTVQLEDANGNFVAQAGVSILAASTPSGVAGQTSVSTDATGKAVFSTLVLSVAQSYTVTFTSSGLTGVTSTAVAIGPSAATKLAFLQNPANTTSGNAISPAVTVQIQDQFNNVVITASNSITITGACGTGTFGLSGTNPVNAAAGMATFSNLIVTGPATNCLLTASATTLGSVASSFFAITAAAPPSIVMVNGPVNDTLSFVAGNQPSTPPTVEVLSASQAPVSGFPVHFHLTDHIVIPGVVDTMIVLKDTTMTTGVTGILNFFPSAALDTVAANFVIVITSGGPTVSAAPPTQVVLVSPAAAFKYVVTATATSTPAPGATVPISAQLTDRYGNYLSTAGKTVAWTVTPATGDGTLSGSPSMTNTSGSTSITYTAPSLGGTAALIKASDGIDTGSVTVTPIAPAALSFTAGGGQLPSSTVQSGVAFPTQPKLQLVDANGNPLAVAGLSIQTVLISGSVGLGGQIPTTGANGVAVFSGLTASGATGTFQLQFAVAGAPSIVSPTITETLTAGPAASMTANSSLQYVQAAGGTSTMVAPVSVLVEDASGNPVVGQSVSWFFGTPCASATFISLASSATTTNSSGVATAPTVNINNANAGSCRLAESVVGVTGNPLFSLILAPSASSAVWLGTTPAWNLGSNWLGGSTPNAIAQVYIPAATSNQPTLPAHTTGQAIQSLTTEAGTGGGLNLNGDTLQLSGNALLSGSVAGGVLHFASSATGQVMGTLPSVIIDQAFTDSLIGSVNFQSNATVDLHGTIAMPSTGTVDFTAVSLLRIFSTANARIPNPFGQILGLSGSNCEYSPALVNNNPNLQGEISASGCTSNASISLANPMTLRPGYLGALDLGVLRSRTVGLEPER